MRYCKLLLVSLLGIFFFNCNEINDKSQKRSSNNSDTIEVDVPEGFSSTDIRWQKIGKIEKELGLKSLTKGFDGQEMRIYIECGNSNPMGIIVLREQQSKWEVSFYSFRMKYLTESDFDVADIQVIKDKMPKSGWQNFTKELSKYNLPELKDYEFLEPEYIAPDDEILVSVEVATSKKYRIYRYPYWEDKRNIQNGSANIYNALKLIKNEFNLDLPCEGYTF